MPMTILNPDSGQSPSLQEPLSLSIKVEEKDMIKLSLKN
jgi:hypothetical protein